MLFQHPQKIETEGRIHIPINPHFRVLRRYRMDLESNQTARMQKGIRIAEAMWFSFAQRIFAIAADLYGWTPKRRAELEDIYLRPNDYTIEVVVMN